MPTETLTFTIQKTISEHPYKQLQAFNGACGCSWRGKTINAQQDYEAHVAEKIAEQLLINGFVQ